MLPVPALPNLLDVSTNKNVRALKGTDSACLLLNTPIEHVFYKISAKWNSEMFCYRNVYFYSEDDASPASQWE